MGAKKGFIGVVGALILWTTSLQAQVCVGAPNGGGLAVEYGRLRVGNSQGAAATFGTGHVAFGLGYRHLSQSADLKGHDGAARFSILLGQRHFQLCPTVALGYRQDRWDIGSGMTMTAHTGTGRAGLGAGFELPVARNVSLIPYGMAQLAFSAKVLKLQASGGENSVNGDTLTRGDFEYGVLARIGPVYAGAAANHASDRDYPYIMRFLAGIAFSPSRKRVVP